MYSESVSINLSVRAGIAKYRLTEALRNGKILSYITVGDIGGIRICGEDSSIISTAELMQKNSLKLSLYVQLVTEHNLYVPADIIPSSGTLTLFGKNYLYIKNLESKIPLLVSIYCFLYLKIKDFIYHYIFCYNTILFSPVNHDK